MCRLTDCKGVIDFEAAEHLVDVSGMEEAVSTHHHLKCLWLQNTETILHLFIFKLKITRGSLPVKGLGIQSHIKTQSVLRNAAQMEIL